MLVFENVGCISRPDTSRSFQDTKIERLRGDGLTRAEPRRLRRRRRGASRVNRRAKTVHLAWTTGRADRAAKRKPRCLRVRLKALRTEARVVLNRTPCLGPRPSGSTVFGNSRQIEIAGRQADGGSGAIGRARAVTGSVRDGRQTAKAPPAEQARGVSVRCERDPTLRGNVDRGSRSRRARRSPFIDKLAEPTPLPSFADPADAKRAGP